MIEQRSEEWFEQRLGRFTGSQIHKLMKSGRAKDQMFGETALTYIKEKVAEIITNGASIEHKKVDTYATKWGTEWEPRAVKMYEEFTFYKVTPCGFFSHGERFGASPDGLIGEDGVLEVKCPYTSEKHVDYLLCETPQDVFNTTPEYYYQMQAEMICAGRKWAEFVSYDPNADERTCLKIIRIPFDKPVADEILARVAAATIILNDILTKIYK